MKRQIKLDGHAVMKSCGEAVPWRKTREQDMQVKFERESIRCKAILVKQVNGEKKYLLGKEFIKKL